MNRLQATLRRYNFKDPLMQRGFAIIGGSLLFTLLNVALLPGRHSPRVEVERIKVAKMPLIVRASGNLEARDSNTVKIQFEGPVMSKSFREGQEVKQGQVLAVIGREKIRLDYQIKHDALLNAQSDLQKTKTDLRLQKTLFKKEAVAYASVEDAARALVKAEQGLRSAQESFRLEQILWNSSSVTAPISGTVVKDWIGEDKIVAAGKEIVTVADVSAFTVKARVDELDIKHVHEGQPAHVSLQIYPDVNFQASVREVGSQPDGNALPEVPVVVSLKNRPDFPLRPKLTAEVKILTGWTEPILSVPLTAVANTDGEPRVWVLGWLGRLRAKRVELGRSNPDRVEITHGLQPRQRVCVSAEPDFADGMRVKIGLKNVSGQASKTNALLSKIKTTKKNDSKDDKKGLASGQRAPAGRRR